MMSKKAFNDKQKFLKVPDPFGEKRGEAMKKAFTLVELLIVIIIIGILATMAIPQYQKMVEKSKAAEASSIIGALKRAEEIYYAQYSVYAEEVVSLDTNLGEKFYPATKSFWYGVATPLNPDWIGGRKYTVNASTNAGTIDTPVSGSPQYHCHDNGDIVKTEVVAYGDMSEPHDHNDGNGQHSHKLPNR